MSNNHLDWWRSSVQLVQRSCHYSIYAQRRTEHKSTFCLRYIRDTYELKRQHNYYYQVQGQLHITRRSWCDFVLWTPSSTVDNLCVERIHDDKTFWTNTIYPRLYRFFMGSMLAELAHPHHISGQEVREMVPFWNDDDLCPAPQATQ